jgi:hypothetical protein
LYSILLYTVTANGLSTCNAQIHVYVLACKLTNWTILSTSIWRFQDICTAGAPTSKPWDWILLTTFFWLLPNTILLYLDFGPFDKLALVKLDSFECLHFSMCYESTELHIFANTIIHLYNQMTSWRWTLQWMKNRLVDAWNNVFWIKNSYKFDQLNRMLSLLAHYY